MNLADLLYSRHKGIKGYFIGIEAAEIGYGLELSKKKPQNCFVLFAIR